MQGKYLCVGEIEPTSEKAARQQLNAAWGSRIEVVTAWQSPVTPAGPLFATRPAITPAQDQDLHPRASQQPSASDLAAHYLQRNLLSLGALGHEDREASS